MPGGANGTLPGIIQSADAVPPPSGRHVCPECAKPFRPVHTRQLFCSQQHKDTFHNRATARGRVLTPMAIAARITRGGSRGDIATGKLARRESQRLIDQWAREDREAGRMDMVTYIAARSKIGY